MFEGWLLDIGFPTGKDHVARKAALLRASLGTEGYRVYSSLVAVQANRSGLSSPL